MLFDLNEKEYLLREYLYWSLQHVQKRYPQTNSSYILNEMFKTQADVFEDDYYYSWNPRDTVRAEPSELNFVLYWVPTVEVRIK